MMIIHIAVGQANGGLQKLSVTLHRLSIGGSLTFSSLPASKTSACNICTVTSKLDKKERKVMP